MAAEKPVPRPVPKDRRASSRSRTKNEAIEPVQSVVLLTSLRAAPWLALVVIGADLLIEFVDGAFPLDLSQVMFLSGIGAVSAALFAFLALLQRVRDTFDALWSRSLVTPLDEADWDPPQAAQPERPPSSANRQLAAEYQRFLDHLQTLLNHPWQWPVGIAFALLVFTWSPGAAVLAAFRRYSWYVAVGAFPWYIFVAVIVEAFVAFVIGTMAWRMVVVGIQVSRLGKLFGLRPQLGHPDQCGGLEPLGDLCLWNALIVSVAGLYLGGWIIILRPRLPGDALAQEYVPLFLALLVAPLVVAAITFFLPLWSVHEIMVLRRDGVRRKLDELGQSIDRSARELLDRASELPFAEGDEKAKRLELMRQTYQQYRNLPVWPFNVQILLKFISSQAVPVLALTGLSEPIREIVKNLIGVLEG